MKVEWNGDGMPPVGTDCEYFYKGAGEWLPCKVTAESSKQDCVAVMYDFGAPIEGLAFAGKDALRPIKTERDKWIEAAAAAVLCGGDLVATANLYDIMGRVYDAGIVPRARIIIGENETTIFG